MLEQCLAIWGGGLPTGQIERSASRVFPAANAGFPAANPMLRLAVYGLDAGVHLGDDPHIMVAEQVYAGRRKALKTDASKARVPLSPSMASWLTELRQGALDAAPVFASKSGTPLNYHNVYSRVLRPALERSGIATLVDREKVVKPGGTEEWREVWDANGRKPAITIIIRVSGVRVPPPA